MPYAFAIACLVLGVGATASAALRIRAELARRRWPTVRGRLLSRGVETTASGWRLKVRYAYQVDGAAHEGDVWRSQPDSAFHFPGQAGPARDALPDEPMVHHDPASPAVSFLAPTPLLGAALQLAVGVAFALLGALILLRLAPSV